MYEEAAGRCTKTRYYCCSFRHIYTAWEYRRWSPLQMCVRCLWASYVKRCIGNGRSHALDVRSEGPNAMISSTVHACHIVHEHPPTGMIFRHWGSFTRPFRYRLSHTDLFQAYTYDLSALWYNYNLGPGRDDRTRYKGITEGTTLLDLARPNSVYIRQVSRACWVYTSVPSLGPPVRHVKTLHRCNAIGLLSISAIF